MGLGRTQEHNKKYKGRSYNIYKEGGNTNITYSTLKNHLFEKTDCICEHLISTFKIPQPHNFVFLRYAFLVNYPLCILIPK